MFRGVLSSLVMAAILLSAAPARAEESKPPAEPHARPACCESSEARIRALEARLAAVEKQRTEAAEPSTAPASDDWWTHQNVP